MALRYVLAKDLKRASCGTPGAQCSDGAHGRRMMKMDRPKENEYASFYAGYVARVPETEILAALREQPKELKRIADSLTPEKERFRYAPDKWSVRELFGHLVDAESLRTPGLLHQPRRCESAPRLGREVLHRELELRFPAPRGAGEGFFVAARRELPAPREPGRGRLLARRRREWGQGHGSRARLHHDRPRAASPRGAPRALRHRLIAAPREPAGCEGPDARAPSTLNDAA